jgi:hypothetical protein
VLEVQFSPFVLFIDVFIGVEADKGIEEGSGYGCHQRHHKAHLSHAVRELSTDIV